MTKQKTKNHTFAKVAISTGLVLMGLSLYAYFKLNTGFIGEVHSEVFGVGTGALVAGIAALIWKIKI